MNEAVEQKTPPRRIMRWIAVLSTAFVFTIIGVGLFHLLSSDRINARLVSAISSQLGAKITIKRVDAGWRGLILTGLSISLDQKGSSLSLPLLHTDLKPFAAIKDGLQIERIIKTVTVVDADLIFAKSSEIKQANQPWLPLVRFPEKLFDILNRFDGLDNAKLRNATVRAIADSDTTVIVSQLHCEANRSKKNLYRFSGSGFVSSDTNWQFRFYGEFDIAKHKLDLTTSMEIPPDIYPLDQHRTATLSCKDGFATFMLTVADSGTQYSGTVNANSLILSVGGQEFCSDSVSLHLKGDSVELDDIEISGFGLHGRLQGSLLLRDDGQIRLTCPIAIDDLFSWRDRLRIKPEIHGRAEAICSIYGSLKSPICNMKFSSPEIHVYDYALKEIAGEALISRKGLDLQQLTCKNDDGTLCIQGNLSFAEPHAWNAEGIIGFSEEPQYLGWKTNVRNLRISGTGTAKRPEFHIIAFDSCEQELCKGHALKSSSDWRIHFESPNGETGVLEIASQTENTTIAGSNVHLPITRLFPDLDLLFRSVEKLDFDYAGNTGYGYLTCDVETLPDSMKFLPQIAREFHLSGFYDSPDLSVIRFNGNWSGIAGNGESFEGKAVLDFQNHVLKFEQFFIDDAGSLTGYADFKYRRMNLEGAIEALSLTRLPIPSSFLNRVQLQGTLTGYTRIQGSFDQPEWAANFAMINGSAFGVPDYWLNLEASGLGQAVRVKNFELGRSIRKIIAASGEIDGHSRQVALTAEVGSARAEDFILALSGKRGILNGDLEGRGTIVGTIPGLDIETEFEVHRGSLLNEIYFDDFSASFQMIMDENGLRSLRIPLCSFNKINTYAFNASAEVFPKDKQMLRGQIHGSGDFLDILDQMDRSFRTKGSIGDFELNIGGTLSNPQLLGGYLKVRDGRFIYPDATPGQISTTITVSLGSTGVIDTGIVHFQTGDQWIEINTLPACEFTEGSLNPIIIHGAQLCLGVLELRTAGNGMSLRIPGLMKDEWVGDFVTGADGIRSITVSTYDENRLLFEGAIYTVNARMTFPFISRDSRPMRPVARWIVERLIEAQWNVDVAVGTGNHYDVEITGLKNSEIFSPLRDSPVITRLAEYFDHLSIDAILDPTEHPLQIRGSIADTSFYLNGKLSSHRGKVEYLDQTFTVDYVYSDFDETDVTPILEGRAATMGRDTLGRQIPVYLTMYQIDRETGTRQKRGRLNDITYVLENDAGDTPEQMLSLLGYNIGDVKGKAEELVASTVVRTIGRQWLDPLERRLERWTLLDEVTLSPGKGRWSSLSRQQRERAQSDSIAQNATVRFFTGSQVTVGKYVTRNLFFTYTGELTENQIDLGGRLGFIHLWNLEYRIQPLSRDLVLDLVVEYDEVVRRRDESVSLKYSFALEP